MVSSVWGMCVEGIQARFVRVEVDIANGLPAFEIVGLPATAVREARERVRAAIRNSGFSFPMQRITVNLAPADLRKEGSGLDLAIAAGILAALGEVPGDLDNYVLSGELSLDGRVRPVTGILTLAVVLRAQAEQREREEGQGWTLVVAQENVIEARLAEKVPCCGVTTLSELVGVLNGRETGQLTDERPNVTDSAEGKAQVDFRDIRGHLQVKRVLEVAAAGAHNVLMIGPPGVGKTLMAKAFAGILPPMNREECLQVTQIYSLAGLLSAQPRDNPLIRQRPFRSPHHTATLSAMMGGGQRAMPGEVALADHGVLFLDELPEFPRDVLEALRQPLEDGVVHIARQKWKAVYPARLSLIATMNPCPCGYLGDLGRECRCTPAQIKAYRGRISGPLLDRFDIQVEVGPLSYEEMHGPGEGEPSAKIARRVAAARELQQERLKGHFRQEKGQGIGFADNVLANARMSGALTREICRLGESGQQLMRRVFSDNMLSVRAYDRVLRVARSIADLAQEQEILTEHVAEAISYRGIVESLRFLE
ncbi:MAG: YifB family Mg chelatase-like AAA ATPase [Peptococcaceae bacterium]|nr:YifB family Mg chelatase-like AAA ATPase [Peptococcaceae bacterium]